jgi:hypothetical protein
MIQIRIPIEVGRWIRIRMEVKSWIRICIEVKRIRKPVWDDMVLPVAGGLEGLQSSEEPGDGLLLVQYLHIPLLGAQVVNQLEQQVF